MYNRRGVVHCNLSNKPKTGFKEEEKVQKEISYQTKCCSFWSVYLVFRTCMVIKKMRHNPKAFTENYVSKRHLLEVSWLETTA